MCIHFCIFLTPCRSPETLDSIPCRWCNISFHPQISASIHAGFPQNLKVPHHPHLCAAAYIIIANRVLKSDVAQYVSNFCHYNLWQWRRLWNCIHLFICVRDNWHSCGWSSQGWQILDNLKADQFWVLPTHGKLSTPHPWEGAPEKTYFESPACAQTVQLSMTKYVGERYCRDHMHPHQRREFQEA